MTIIIRPALIADHDAIWAIMEPVIRAGETYALPRNMDRAEALAYWTGADRECFVACRSDDILGTYYLRANQPGPGSHVANCGFMTAARATGQGVARSMAAHALAHARARNFTAMQFNLVVKTNSRAVKLWHSLGFVTLAEIPGAFRHPVHGLIPALVMHRAV
ncbi:MAG: GNAT family N-acetyltransferase [Acidocella sp.]|nr:GNAT family N-acetyltransferase [Acidocella sp.]